MYTRKAQVQMGENVIILFIFFILLVFGIVFFTRIQTAQSAQKISQDVQGRGIEIAQKIAFLPEIQCSKTSVEQYACYDEVSLEALRGMTANGKTSEYYYPLLGYSTISIQNIFPVKQDPILIYNNTKPDYTSSIATFLPVVICNYLESPQGDACRFGVLDINVYN